jgi:hypothetical protein
MKKCLPVLVVILTVGAILGAAWVFAAADPAEAAKPLLAHNVYFSLKDKSESGKKEVVAACKKYLSGHPGTVFFAAGVLAEECNRPVNDRDFDVALHIIFKDKAAHDAYQKAERHVTFAKEYDSRWTKVRVFDSYVQP